MEVITGDRQQPRPKGATVVTIGAYDGVHLGHREVIAGVRAKAASMEAASAVVTFDRHPASVVRPDSAPLLLTDVDQKLELLEGAGLDYALVLAFDRDRAEESPEAFVTEVIVQRLAARAVVVGRNFHFGRGRRGDVSLLEELGQARGFEVAGVDLVSGPEGGEAVSSTRIREMLRRGQVADAARLLGRPHEVRGTVGRGDGRGGALLGYPTANVAVAGDVAVPADGIYAGWYERPDGSTHAAAISVGRRPTFYASAPPLLEAYLLGFEGDLYDERARVRFVARLRDDVAFDSVPELVAQMGRDVDAARAALAHPV